VGSANYAEFCWIVAGALFLVHSGRNGDQAGRWALAGLGGAAGAGSEAEASFADELSLEMDSWATAG
jgi:hypothetical protein